MQIAYIQRKTFADGSQEIRISKNEQITPFITQIARDAKKINQEKRKQRRQYLYGELYDMLRYGVDDWHLYRKYRNELEQFNFENLKRSVRRCRQQLYDICRCNEFKYFVTVTFNNAKVDRMNDSAVKRKFSQLMNYLRKRYPDMFYVAVPEYHENGGLHFHLLVGGITLNDLGAVPARYPKRKGRHKKGDPIFKNGLQVFNLEKWKYGFSTLTVLKNVEASKHYICKYVTKQNVDPRFFKKRRYYVSYNIKRPTVEVWQCPVENCLDCIDFDKDLVKFAKPDRGYAVFAVNGVTSDKPNTESCRHNVVQLKSVPYWTIGTLVSDSTMEDEKQACISRILAYNRRNHPPGDMYTQSDNAPIYDNTAYCRDLGLLA